MDNKNDQTNQREDCLSLNLRTVIERRLCNDLDENKAVVDLFRHARGLPMLHYANTEQAIADLPKYRHNRHAARGAAVSGDAPASLSAERNTLHANQNAAMIGTRLHELLSRIGIEQKQGCGCGSRQRQLDAMSIEDIQFHRTQIEDMLNAQAKQLTMRQKLAAFANAAKQGVFINPLNPARSILDHAIRQAEQQTTNKKANI